MAAAIDAKARLEGWKEVAAFFRKDERTVKRWEVERGLPVRRYPGAGRSRIFARVAELEAWRDGAAVVEPDAPAALVVGHGRRPRHGWSIAVASLLAVAGVAGAGLVGWRALERTRPPSLEAQKLFVAGSEDRARRTPDSLERAVDEFNGAIALDHDYAEAWAGRAATYDILREYTQFPAAQAYLLARNDARRAVALDDRLAMGHAALAFADYWGFWDAAAAQRGFAKAVSLDQRSATAQQWYATFLSARGQQGEALQHIEAARALKPRSLAVLADRGLILYLGGRDAEGLASLQAVERADPDFLSPHVYLAVYYLNHRQIGDYLDEADSTARSTGDAESSATVAAMRRSLAIGGPDAALKTLEQRQLERYRNGQVSAYSVANAYAVADDRASALTFLRLSLDRRESEMMAARGNPAFGKLRGSPEFAAIMTEAGPLSPG
jgi:Tfp pilus assembly protein PilF